MSLKLKLGLFITALFVTAIGNAIFTFVLESYSDEKLRWVNHTHEVILETQTYLGALKDTEIGQRGYLLTKDNNYLEPYHRGIVLAEKSFTNLLYLTSDNPIQQKRLKIMNTSMQLKFTELQKTIELAQSTNENHLQALKIVKKNQGKKLMDDIRLELDKFISTEYLLLETRKGDFREQKAILTTLISLEIVFFIFLALITFLFLNRNLFEPLQILLEGTHTTENGERIKIDSILPKGEMGYLISSLIKMNEVVHTRTKNLNYIASHDELTGLKNRSKLFDSIANLIKSAQESQTKVALLFLDLNKFKPLNDTLGHDAGDFMLKEIAQRLEASTREDDLVFRIGGDEFVVLLHNLTNVEEVKKSIEHILTSLAPTVIIQNQNIKIEVSIGVALSPDNSLKPEELVKYADIAMYEAKKSAQTFVLFENTMLKRASD